ncbi:MAG: PAS domain-containing protein, partial [Nitrospirae bacterium]|nr:PAS domain-containing protein [Nitrospirota bacterium]
FGKTLGYTDEELKSRPFIEFVHPDDVEKTLNEVKKLSQGIPAIDFENRYLCKDGRYKHIQWRSSPVPDAGMTYATARDITQQKEMVEAIKTERDKLRGIMDSMQDGVYIVSADYEIEFVNNAIIREFGEVNDCKCYEYFHDGTGRCSWCKRDEVFAGKTLTWEWYCTKNNKTYSHFDTPIKNTDGSISKFSIIHDISDVQSAQVVMKRELDFQSAIAEVSEALLSPDKDIADISLIVNRQAMRLTDSLHGHVSEIDRKTEEQVNHTFTEMMADGQCSVDTRHTRQALPKGKDGYNALWGHVLNTRQAFYTNHPQGHPAYKGCLPQGHIRLTRYLAAPAMMGDKLIGNIALANAHRDYTDDDLNIIKRLAYIYALAVERKRMEEELKQVSLYNKWLLDALDNVAGYIYIKDKELRYVYANKITLELFKCTMEDLIGSNDSRFFTAETLEGFLSNDRRVIENGEISEQEEDTIPQSIGKRVVYWAVKRPLFDAEGNIWGLCGVSTDITERKRMEEELKRLNSNLAAMVKEETSKRQMQEQMLIQQSKMAAMGEMIGLIAHQWKQPLNAIAIIVQDMKDAYKFGEVDEEYIERTIDSTMGQVKFMSKTMDDFRNFFKPSRQKVTFDVKNAIDELISMFIAIFTKNNINVYLKAEQSLKLIANGYPNEFKQVILNILNNSKDAIISRQASGDKTQGLIEVEITGNEKAGQIVIYIRDNGGGIPEKVMDRMFEPYFTTKGTEGTGIGLYMSKTIIETNMGGSLTVKNIDGGAEFAIALSSMKEGDTSFTHSL